MLTILLIGAGTAIYIEAHQVAAFIPIPPEHRGFPCQLKPDIYGIRPLRRF